MSPVDADELDEELEDGLEDDLGDDLAETGGKVKWVCGEEAAGGRIDKVVTDRLGEPYSRSQIQQWIKDGMVTVGDRPVKANYKVASGDCLEVRIPEAEPSEVVPEPIKLDVVYEDGDVIVVNKPRGMVVHPAAGHSSGTLVNALLYHCRDLSGINGVMRPGIVHRIDKDTSGLLMAAKNDAAHLSLAQQLQDHSVTRMYMALLQGRLAHDVGTVDAPIGRDARDRKLFAVTERGGKRAVTHFRVVERFDGYTLAELRLETGRTHQIRVHMKYIGHPLVGDPQYGGPARRGPGGIDGQALHAAVLGFIHPRTGAYMEFAAELPQDMQKLLERLRRR
jgi:23S rRNA pseudouridine1911/1915/1917 synthase